MSDSDNEEDDFVIVPPTKTSPRLITKRSAITGSQTVTTGDIDEDDYVIVPEFKNAPKPLKKRSVITESQKVITEAQELPDLYAYSDDE